MKKAFVFLVVVLFCSGKLYSQTLDNGLLIYYNWDSTFDDQSLNGFHPSYAIATFVEDRNGNPSSALYFNGLDNYIELPDFFHLRPLFPLSFSFWFKLDNLSPENGVLFDNDFNETTHSGVMMNISSSERLGIAYGNGEGFYLYARKTFLTDVHLKAVRWYHLVGVIHNRFDMRIFINGEEQTGFLDGSAEDMVYVGGVGNIGRQDANYHLDPYYFKGVLDEFRYWNRGLSNDEVRLLYEAETLSVDRNVINSVKVYPNPVKDKVFITLGDYYQEMADYLIRIVNTNGQIIFESEFNSSDFVIHVNDFGETGLFFLKIIDPDQNIIDVRKILLY